MADWLKSIFKKLWSWADNITLGNEIAVAPTQEQKPKKKKAKKKRSKKKPLKKKDK